MNRNLMSVARKALTKVHNPNSPATNNKLFVAGLSWSVDERSLKDAFCSFGDVTEGAGTLQNYHVIHLFDELSQCIFQSRFVKYNLT
ncbi:TRANSFORMER-2-RELATED [Salix koriyanagi]|uniref:TRANSFORMER-2-RELATED n=1 Tax=Salix koriyanagi TaxID=2511006 RepID=A0A9Q0U5C4_9ROSI|nr:TRANSFORMER-2-RELATED [Salix koriyanagi]